MALESYHRKRDFTTTPEPVGAERVSDPDRLSFVIQKHAARRLHYDFRLELDGVLLSWAVPKGPSTDPEQKRLAVRTEDHPIEYGEFEGTIPKGEYGGGTVMLWDRGVWRPIGDPHVGLKRGRLEFELEGERLRGRWRLVRTRDTDEWLLMKAHDEAAGGEEPVERFETSVASDRTMEAIATGEGPVWTRDVPTGRELLELPGARRGEIPEDARPALATRAEKPPRGDGWLHELKLDGYRVLLRLERGRARVLTRSGLDWTARVPAVARAIEALAVRDAVLDGELVAYEPDGRTSFAKLQHDIEADPDALVVEVFDCLGVAGVDLREVPLAERKRVLARILGPRGPGRIRYVDHVTGEGARVFEAACGLGAEGIVSKRADGRYRSGRVHDWIKTKCRGREDFVIGGFLTRGGSPLSSLLLGERDDDGALRYVGRVGTGFTEADRERIRAKLEPLIRRDLPFVERPDLPKREKVFGVEPVLSAEVRYLTRTAGGLLRQASFQGLREDAPAPIPLPSVPAVTNADKVLYPEIGLTKGQLAAWIAEMAPWILPHLAGRPLTLVRCPHGHARPCFFQKHLGHAPPGVEPVRVPDDDEPYLTVYDAEGLVGLVQLGALEIHPWGSRGDRPERPDRVIFDLDPDESLPFTRVIAAAREVRARLDELGLVSFVRWSGGKGLHVVLPIDRRHGWDDVKAFARGLAEELVRSDPQSYVATVSKQRRKGRIFVDWMRNSMGATAIGTWVFRARPGAPVAAPLRWEDLEDLDTARLTVPRVRPPAEDPWEGFFEVRQTIAKALRHLR